MSAPRAIHYRWDELPKEQLSEQLGRRLISTDRMMLAHVYLEKGCIVPRHSHENEQLTWILEGVLRFWLGDDESEVVDVSAGEVLHIPSHLPHKAEALETTLDVDIFCPPRQDWLDGFRRVPPPLDDQADAELRPAADEEPLSYAASSARASRRHLDRRHAADAPPIDLDR